HDDHREPKLGRLVARLDLHSSSLLERARVDCLDSLPGRLDPVAGLGRNPHYRDAVPNRIRGVEPKGELPLADLLAAVPDSTQRRQAECVSRLSDAPLRAYALEVQHGPPLSCIDVTPANRTYTTRRNRAVERIERVDHRSRR